MEKTNLLTELKKRWTEKTYPAALILSGKNQIMLETISDEIIRFMVCANQSLTDDQCSFCQRALKHKLLDVLYLGDGVNEIGKDSIKAMMDQLSLSALEIHGQKIYVVKNAENLKINAANALLKFLEEPPVNTYAFFLTKDRTKILPTIRSRCQLLVLSEPLITTKLNDFEILLQTRNRENYLLASDDFKKMDKTSLIQDLELAYHRTILQEFPQFLEATLVLIQDLKSLPNEKLAIDNYFIQIAERL